MLLVLLLLLVLVLLLVLAMTHPMFIFDQDHSSHTFPVVTSPKLQETNVSFCIRRFSLLYSFSSGKPSSK